MACTRKDSLLTCDSRSYKRLR